MLNTAATANPSTPGARARTGPHGAPVRDRAASAASGVDPAPATTIDACQRLVAALTLLQQALAPARRVVHAGDIIYRAGERLGNLYILNCGFAKIVDLSPDGREQVVGLKFRGDWLGFDGIASERYCCDAIALDTGEVWVLRYDALLVACASQPALLALLHQAMSREIARERASLMSICTLPADARVAEFLRNWAESLALSGLRSDQITLRLTRAEIGNYLGMTLESVSRALSKMALARVIVFAAKGRREIRIMDLAALSAYFERCLAPAPPLQ